MLQNIQLEFLPANTTSSLQQLDMTIIKILNTLYHAKFVNHIELIHRHSQSRKVGQKINVLQALQFVSDTWREISLKTIKNSFPCCGFKRMGQEMAWNAQNLLEICPELHKVTNHVSIDDNIEYCKFNKNCDGEIDERIQNY